MSGASAKAVKPNIRYPVVDLVRGGALALMVVYHFFWDLDTLGFMRLALYDGFFWLAFRSLILVLFLGVVGVSLVLAGDGAIDRKRFVRRLVIVLACGALISAGSFALFPESPVIFGVLQAIAVASVIGLVLRRWSWPALAGAAIVLLVASRFPAAMFDDPWLQWLGLMTYQPVANDYVPLLPWLAAVLAGMALARWMLAAGLAPRAAGWAFEAAPGPWLRLAGRHSLLIYMVHQPVLFGLLYVVILVAPPQNLTPRTAETGPYPVSFRADFLKGCERQCRAQGADARACAASCDCSLAVLRENFPWPKVRAGRLDDDDRARIVRLARQCVAERRRHK